MVLSLASKVVLGGFLLTASAGLSLGGALFTVKNMKGFKSIQSTKSSETEKSVSITPQIVTSLNPKHGTCTIYAVENNGPDLLIEEADNDFLKKEESKGNRFYQNIKIACDNANGEDIFVVSKKFGFWPIEYERWVYSELEQDNQRFKTYVREKLRNAN